MLNIAIVECEKKSRELLLSFFDRYAAEKGESFHTVCFDSPVGFLTGYKPNYDIVFMTAESQDMDGIKASRRLRALDSAVALVLVSDTSALAVSGYEVDVRGYMLRPVSYRDFSPKLERIIERIGKVGVLKIPLKDGMVCVKTDDVKYVEAADHKVIFHTVNGKYTATGSLKGVENTLNAGGGSLDAIAAI